MKKRNDKIKKKSGKKNINKSSNRFTFFKNIFSNFNNSEFEIENNKKQQIFRSFILLCSVLISSYLIFATVNKLDKYLPVSDEGTNIMQITGGIEMYGYPYLVSPAYFGVFVPEELLVKKRVGFDTRHYIIENYLRYFVFWGNNYFDYNWKSFSSIFYMLLFFIGLFVYSIIAKKQRLPLLFFSILFILIGYSTWASASFHYVRYYPFLFFVQLFSMIFCSYLFSLDTKNRILKNLLILLLGYLPAEFHQQGLFSFLFWLAIVVLSEIYILFRRKSIPIKYKIISIISIIIAITGITYFGEYGIQQGLGLISNKKAFFNILDKFIDLNFNTSSYGAIFTILILIGGVISIPKLSKIERNLLLFSTVFFIGATIGSSMIMGDSYTGYNGSNRYHFFLHSIYLIILAILIIGIIYNIKEQFKKEYLKQIAIVILILPFAFGIYKVNNLDISEYSFSILPKVTISSIEKVKQELSNTDYVLFTTEVHITNIGFPQHKTNSISKLATFREAMQKIETEYILFYRVYPSRIEESLQAKLAMLSNYNSMLCLISRDEIIQAIK